MCMVCLILFLLRSPQPLFVLLLFHILSPQRTIVREARLACVIPSLPDKAKQNFTVFGECSGGVQSRVHICCEGDGGGGGGGGWKERFKTSKSHLLLRRPNPLSPSLSSSSLPTLPPSLPSSLPSHPFSYTSSYLFLRSLISSHAHAADRVRTPSEKSPKSAPIRIVVLCAFLQFQSFQFQHPALASSRAHPPLRFAAPFPHLFTQRSF
jgi:hypothetical protein